MTNETPKVSAPRKTEPGERAKPKTFPEMLAANLEQIKAALPRHLSADRMARIALTCFRLNPTLAKCDPLSILSCVVQSAQLGLEPGIGGEAHLVPFKDQKGNYACQFIPGYTGLVKLALNSGAVSTIECFVVYETDKFEMSLGFDRKVVWEPNYKGSRGEPLLAFGIARLKDSRSRVFDFMTAEDINAVRDKSQGYLYAAKNKKQSPWLDKQSLPEMWRKTMARRLCKWLPKSAELLTAMELDTQADLGIQSLNIEGVLSGDISSGAPVDDTAEPPPQQEYTALIHKQPSSANPFGEIKPMPQKETVSVAGKSSLKLSDEEEAAALADLWKRT